MSASLVGSEMCIRDRSWRCTSGPSAAPRTCVACSRAGSSSGCSVPAAVSYTHLTLPTICSV
eukprot:10852402-Alexandrium_andersonii.AAC.1